MTADRTYFGLDGEGFGIFVMQTMRDAMHLIRSMRGHARVEVKGKTSSGRDDHVTEADRDAQALYLNAFRDRFPDVGIIAEEDELFIEPSGDEDIILTLDPLDGTNAFVRGQSHGIATMVGMLVDGKLAGGWVGDVMTGEIFAADPGGEGAYVTGPNWGKRPLAPKKSYPLRDQYLLFRHQPEQAGPDFRALAAHGDDDRLYKDMLIDTGSVGVHCARLWNGEIGGFLVEPTMFTPWDNTPCDAISERLGIVPYEVSEDMWFTPSRYEPVLEKRRTTLPILHVPGRREAELCGWRDRFTARRD